MFWQWLEKAVQRHIGNPIVDMFALVVTMNIMAVVAVLTGYLEATTVRSASMIGIDCVTAIVMHNRHRIASWWNGLHMFTKYHALSTASAGITVILLGCGYLLFAN